MTIPRTQETEVMDTEEEARDYDAMDHSAVNAAFCDDLLAFRAAPSRVLDVGTGTALIPIELCARSKTVRVEALDLAEHMLAVGRRNVARAQLDDRLRLHHVDAKHTAFAEGTFDLVMSNSIVHHIPNPADVLYEALRLTTRGGALFVRDLARPDTAARVDQLVDLYAPRSTSTDASIVAMHYRQRTLFAASLHAAHRVEEVRAMVAPLGIPSDAVRMTSDRHWTLAYAKP